MSRKGRYKKGIYMSSKVIFQQTVAMLKTDLDNFMELIKCNALEAELEATKVKKYKITIEEE